ncbi:erg24, C-14 sterol reductase [Hanseniaspora osmophila]|uniref:Delta(14)-sterol reductase n=1 Tax=Hanseniaspora osmophila TaxID=56408 RepID=A0A1E5R0J6_9ASCO|nr:Delta(14)-sterol reductase [Hanseniaspora osmophila]
MSTKEKRIALNPKTTAFEFNGVSGALAITFGLPAVVVVLNQMIRPDYYIKGVFENFHIEEIVYNLRPLKDYFKLHEIWCYYLVWFFGLAFFDVVLPGKSMKGTELRDGSKLDYKINGIALSSLLLAILSFRWKLTDGQMPELQYLYNNHLDICIITILFSFLLATVVFIMSYIPLIFSKNKLGSKEKILALGGNSSNFIYNWFIGRELNPRIGPLDIKLFCELRPGMLLWLLINLSCLHHHYLKTGEVNDALLLVNILQGFYIFDGVLNEEGCLTMMDITTDGFGYMLAFGDLSLVPFTYSLQARYLSCSPITLGREKLIFIGSVMALGYWIFHASNMQKSEFRQGKLPNLKSIQTKRGTKLLCDGWWSVSQHINYFGDWLISLSWCLTTWFQTPLTYYYSLYFATLLLHRQKRDEHKCREKYGKSWEQYEKEVPYKIIPYVY